MGAIAVYNHAGTLPRVPCWYRFQCKHSISLVSQTHFACAVYYCAHRKEGRVKNIFPSMKNTSGLRDYARRRRINAQNCTALTRSRENTVLLFLWYSICYSICFSIHFSSQFLWYFVVINPRRACAARVTVVILCVCLSVCPNTLFWQYAQLEV